MARLNAHSVDGWIISDHVGVRECWAEYFEQLYQVDPSAVCLDAQDVEIPVPDPPISEDPPTLTEIREVISKLKGGKAAGICDIPAELLKAGALYDLRCLAHLFCFYPLTILERIRNHLPRHQRPEQSGFTPGKSTIDSILTLRVIVERHHEFGCGLLAANIDLKKAFDSVHRELLWEILRLRGVPARIIRLIASVYTGTESAVKCGGGLSSFFPVNMREARLCPCANTFQHLHGLDNGQNYFPKSV
ncbi:uncharacterized protein [Penaeus vannamei]|uniref:uncharacterized protein n=1 Tax=Penaeus vannamei TaxID=6689 RepID=UPI00387F3E68